MLGMLISVGGEALNPIVVGVVAATAVERAVGLNVEVVGGATVPAFAAVGRGGGFCRSAYPMPNTAIPPTRRMIASVAAALRGDHTFDKVRTTAEC
jgi:hypothetical protein